MVADMRKADSRTQNLGGKNNRLIASFQHGFMFYIFINRYLNIYTYTNIMYENKLNILYHIPT